MRIMFSRSGGVAGMRWTTTVDEARLTAKEVVRLRRLIEDANFFKLPANITSPNSGPDRFQYELTIGDETRQHSVTVSEEAASPVLRPLLDWLTQTARRK